MRSRNTYLSLLLICITVFSPSLLSAQELGIRWTIPEETARMYSDLNIFSDAGVSIVEVTTPVDEEALQALISYEFEIWIHSGLDFIIPSEMNIRINELKDQFRSLSDEYGEKAAVTRMGLFNNSHISHPDFNPPFMTLLDTLTSETVLKYYYTENNSYKDAGNDLLIASLFTADAYDPSQLSSLQDSLLRYRDEQRLLFLKSDWFLDAAKDQPEFTVNLSDAGPDDTYIFPLPETEKSSVDFNLSVILLLIMWSGIAFISRYDPTYRTILIRYFTAHQFYVDDIIQYRERSSFNGFVLLLFHALFGAQIFTISADTLVSPAALQAFYHHAPSLAIFGSGLASVFTLGFVLVLSVEAIAIAWIHFPNKEIRHLSQTINLYSWIFHLDLIFGTLITTFYLGGASNGWILSVLIGYMLIWFLAFNTAANDAAKALTAGRPLYLFITIGLHLIATIGVVVLVFTIAPVREVIDLMLYLSN